MEPVSAEVWKGFIDALDKTDLGHSVACHLDCGANEINSDFVSRGIKLKGKGDIMEITSS